MPWHFEESKGMKFKIFKLSTLLWNYNANPALHLQALSRPTLYYIALHS